MDHGGTRCIPMCSVVHSRCRAHDYFTDPACMVKGAVVFEPGPMKMASREASVVSRERVLEGSGPRARAPSPGVSCSMAPVQALRRTPRALYTRRAQPQTQTTVHIKCSASIGTSDNSWRLTNEIGTSDARVWEGGWVTRSRNSGEGPRVARTRVYRVTRQDSVTFRTLHRCVGQKGSQ